MNNIKEDKENNSNIQEDLVKNENSKAPEEFGGYKGPNPTQHGDWAHKGRVSDF